MKKLIFHLLALCLAPTVTEAAIRINEVHFNVEGPDENYEFIELKSTTNGVESLAGLSLVIINTALSEGNTTADPQYRNPGEVVEVFDLSELSTGTNGLLLLGNGYTDSPPGGPWSGAVDPATAMGDPSGMGDSDIQSNDGLSILLVRNYNAVSGPKGTDIDKDPLPFVAVPANAISTGNGIIDWKQVPPPVGAVPQLWADADVIDSVGTNDYKDTGNPVDNGAYGARASYVVATLNTFWGASSTLGQRDPDTFARLLGNDTVNSAGAYYGGKMNDLIPTPTDILYRTNRIFGPGGMLGQVTPGRPNLSASLPPTEFRINEVGLNPSGNLNSDDRFQYVEIINTSGQSRSLSGYWLILVDSFDDPNVNGESPGVGSIIEEWNLSDFATGPNGLLLLGDGFSPTFTPFQDAVSPQTAIGDPTAKTGPPASTGWGSRDLRFKDGHTLFLVRNYNPPSQKDLDLSPEDGAFDSTPLWTPMDQIGFTQAGKTTIGRTYSAVNLRNVMDPLTVPDNLSRKLGNLDNLPATAASAWYGGRFPGGASPMNLGFEASNPTNVGGSFGPTWFGGFRGAGTPGQPNLAAAINPASPPLPGSIRINEVMINPTDDVNTSSDQSNEYIELASTSESLTHLEGLWVLVVELSGNLGNIKTGFPLDGYTTGTNGLVLLGDGYDNSNLFYSAREGPLPAATAAFDPPVGLEQNEIPNNGCAILLVRGIKGPITLQANGKPIGDLDPDDDSVLLDPSAYTDALIDSIAVSAISPGAGYGWVDSTTFLPHHVGRYPANFTASNASSWYAGQIEQTAPFELPFPFTAYTGPFLGQFQGAASPGRANHGATPGPTNIGDVLFNEINFNPAGADENAEFIEIISTNGAARSLNGYTILAIDNQVNNTGGIRHAWSLDGLATGTNGLLMLGNRYPTAGQNPWQNVIRAQTGLGDPLGRDGLDSSFGNAIIAGDTGNLNLTLLLVRNFNSFLEFDLDDRTPLQPNPPTQQNSDGTWETPGDGVFDFFPWQGGSAGLHDSFMLRSYAPTVPAGTGPTYPYDGWTYGLPNLTATFFPTPTQLFYHPESIARFRGENTPNAPNVWYGGDLSGGVTGSLGTAEEYVTSTQDPTHPPRPAGFWGRVTPGQPNLIRDSSADPDNDGVKSLVEAAINTNPTNAASAGPLPAPTTITDGGQTYLGLSYPRIRTGVLPTPVPYAAEAYSYVLETSPDLTTWTPDPGTGVGALVQVGTPTANPDGVTETVTVRLPAPVTTPPGRHYIRLRINRR